MPVRVVTQFGPWTSAFLLMIITETTQKWAKVLFSFGRERKDELGSWEEAGADGIEWELTKAMRLGIRASKNGRHMAFGLSGNAIYCN